MTYSNEKYNGLTLEFFNSFVSSTIKTYKQGEPSWKDGKCKYRGTGQACCIIGHSLSDEHYFEGMDLEMMSSGDTDIVYALELSVGTKMKEHDTRLAQLLQVLHDVLCRTVDDEFKEELFSRLEEGDISREYPEFVSAVKLAIDKGA